MTHYNINLFNFLNQKTGGKRRTFGEVVVSWWQLLHKIVHEAHSLTALILLFWKMEKSFGRKQFKSAMQVSEERKEEGGRGGGGVHGFHY